MLIKNNNLTIRNATPEDAEILTNWWNDGKVMEHAGFPNGLGEKAEDIARSLAKDTDDTHRRLIIEVDNMPVGEMNYRNKGEKTAEIGIKICDFSKHDKGMGTQFLSMFINSLFAEMGYEKIILDTNVKNLRAQHVYEKLGFCRIRVNENAWKNQLGQWESSVDYELREENFINFVK